MLLGALRHEVHVAVPELFDDELPLRLAAGFVQGAQERRVAPRAQRPNERGGVLAGVRAPPPPPRCWATQSSRYRQGVTRVSHVSSFRPASAAAPPGWKGLRTSSSVR